MRVLLDHCVDVRFAKSLPGHDVRHTKELGWEALSNGRLLDAAENQRFEVLVTVDKNVRFQQNIKKRTISLITLNSRFVDIDYLIPLASELLQVLAQDLPPGSEIVIAP